MGKKHNYLEDYIALFNAGNNIYEIAKIKNVSRQTVHKTLVNHGIITPKKKPDKEYFKQRNTNIIIDWNAGRSACYLVKKYKMTYARIAEIAHDNSCNNRPCGINGYIFERNAQKKERVMYNRRRLKQQM